MFFMTAAGSSMSISVQGLADPAKAKPLRSVILHSHLKPFCSISNGDSNFALRDFIFKETHKAITSFAKEDKCHGWYHGEGGTVKAIGRCGTTASQRNGDDHASTENARRT